MWGELALVRLVVLQTLLGPASVRSHREEERFELQECGCSQGLEKPYNGRSAYRGWISAMKSSEHLTW